MKKHTNRKPPKFVWVVIPRKGKPVWRCEETRKAAEEEARMWERLSPRCGPFVVVRYMVKS